ncbi:MAG: hypothetical protein M3Y57_09510 [Acidobacteriota bacterium]|nr:hypothetical protein [Acidobacteriota bacterium]
MLVRAALAVGIAVTPAAAQTFDPPGAFAIEVSLENSSMPRLPMHRNAITSLEIVGDYAIGGTSADAGFSPYLFMASISKRQTEMVFPLDEAVTGQRSIPGGFGRGAGGALYAGTIPQSEGGSGHLIRVAVKGERLAVRDLGIPAPGEGIFTVIADPKRETIYGLAYPSGRFFSFHLPDGKVTLYGETAPDKAALKDLSEYVLKPDDYLSRRLVIDAAGRVYGSCPLGGLFRFDPASKKVDIRKDAIPSVSGHLSLARADAWAVAPDGMVYGSNAADGQLFTLNPDSGKIVNLGKPAMTPRMEGIAFGDDGVLYGVTGGRPGYAHVFTYQTGNGFTDFGNLVCPMTAPGIEQGIPWRAFQIATVTASEDGRYIVMGEDEALSQLMVMPISRGQALATPARQ